MKLYKKLLLFLFLLLLPLQVFAASISTLTDNFNDNSIDGAKWGTYNDAGTTILETNQEIEITTALLSYKYAALYSANAYDLTGSQATIKVIDAGNQALASFRWYFALDDGQGAETNRIMWYIRAGTIYCADDTNGQNYSASYVAATYKYLRIRESGGTTYWDYSADGVTWTNAVSKANPSNVTAKYAEIYTYNSSVELSTTTVKVDDFNILPSGAVIKPIQAIGRGIGRGILGGGR